MKPFDSRSSFISQRPTIQACPCPDIRQGFRPNLVSVILTSPLGFIWERIGGMRLCITKALSFPCWILVRLPRLARRSSKMSATKAQSQKIFEKLKSKPANKVYGATRTLGATELTSVDLLRLRAKESNMVIRTVWRVSLSRLLVQPPKPRSAHLLCQIDQSGRYGRSSRGKMAVH